MENLFNEWEKLINEITRDEKALSEWKTLYNLKSEEIIAETDFKKLYGANNQKVRDNHVKTELHEWYTNIQDLEWDIEYKIRRISFLKHLIQYKTQLIRGH